MKRACVLLLTTGLFASAAGAGVGEQIRNGSTLSANDLEALLRSATHAADVRRSLQRRTVVRGDERGSVGRRSAHSAEVSARMTAASRFSARVMADLERMTEFTDTERSRIDDEFRPNPSVFASRMTGGLGGPTEFSPAERRQIRDASAGGDYTKMLLGLDASSKVLRQLLQNRSIAPRDRLDVFKGRSAD